jgi:hypothetical protein
LKFVWNYIFGTREKFDQFNPADGVAGFLRSFLDSIVDHVYKSVIFVHGVLKYLWKLLTVDILGFFTTIFKSLVSHGHFVYMFMYNTVLMVYTFLRKLFIEDFFGFLVNGFYAIISLVIKFVTSIYNSIITYLYNPGADVVKFFFNIFRSLVNLGYNIFMFFYNGVIMVFNFLVKLLVVDIFGGIVNMFYSVISLIIKGFKFAFDSFISFLYNPVSGILYFIGHIFGTIVAGIESFVRYVYVIGKNTLFNPISTMGVIFTSIWSLIVNIFTNIAHIFLGLSSSLSGVGSDIYYFLKLIYNFFWDMMNFNVAVGQSAAAVSATTANVAAANVAPK